MKNKKDKGKEMHPEDKDFKEKFGMMMDLIERQRKQAQQELWDYLEEEGFLNCGDCPACDGLNDESDNEEDFICYKHKEIKKKFNLD